MKATGRSGPTGSTSSDLSESLMSCLRLPNCKIRFGIVEHERIHVNIVETTQMIEDIDTNASLVMKELCLVFSDRILNF